LTQAQIRLKYRRAKGAGTSVSSFVLDPLRYAHAVLTSKIAENETGVVQAKGSAGSSLLQVEMDTDSGFSGASVRRIFPLGSRWSEQP